MLRKYSTMGNATTFPVQTLFFLSVILGTVLYKRNLKVSEEVMRQLGKEKVRVFGDDLIVPDDCAGAIVDALHALGLRVNPDKTFLTGKFRESCGVDAYDGHDVTTISVLDAPNQTKPGSVVSSVDVHNNLCKGGYYWAAAYVQKTVISKGIKHIPQISHGSGSFGWFPNYISPDVLLRSKFDADLQVRKTRCLSLVTKVCVAPSEGTAALLQYFTEAARYVKSEYSTLHYHLQRAKSSLRLSWVVLQ